MITIGGVVVPPLCGGRDGNQSGGREGKVRLETAVKLSNRLGVNVETLFEIDYYYDFVRVNAAREYLESLRMYEQYEYII